MNNCFGLLQMHIQAPCRGSHRVVLTFLGKQTWFSESNWTRRPRLSTILFCGFPDMAQDNYAPPKQRDNLALKVAMAVVDRPPAENPIVIIQVATLSQLEAVRHLTHKGWMMFSNQFVEGVYHMTLIHKDYK